MAVKKKAKKAAPAATAEAAEAAPARKQNTNFHVAEALRVLGSAVNLQLEDRQRFDAAVKAVEG